MGINSGFKGLKKHNNNVNRYTAFLVSNEKKLGQYGIKIFLVQIG